MISKPEFGAPLPVRASPDALRLLAERRSSPAQTLGEPGPTAEQLDDLLTLAARVPDHGKLAPWRFVLIDKAAKPALIDRLTAIAAEREDTDVAVSKLAKLAAAPVSVLVVSAPQSPSKIPLWEQELSAGAVCAMLLVAAEAMGFGANWITDWYAYDRGACAALGLSDKEKVAGFIHLGTPPEAPLERARPDLSTLTSRWSG